MAALGTQARPDLIHWSSQKYVPVMSQEPTTINAWAPEITYDKAGGEYMIYWASTIPGRFPATDSSGDGKYNHRMYYTTTKDFTKFTKTKLLYDQGFTVIDASIQKAGDEYIMFLKDETKLPTPQKNIRIATSKTLTGGYSQPSQPITGKYWAEGPTAIYTGKEWIVYFDKYTEHSYGAVASANLKDWQDISAKIKFPKGTRHGTVLKITQQELNALLKQ